MDSGDLLTTCAGSGATLVAIIGGFLLTRYMAVEGEVRGADRSVAQVKLRLEAAAERLDTAEQALIDYDIDEAFDSRNFILLLVTSFDEGIEVDVEAARTSVALEKFSDEDVDRRLRVWRAETAKARGSEVWSFVHPQVHHKSLRTFMQSMRLSMEIEPIWHALYESEKDAKRDEMGGKLGPPTGRDDYDLIDVDAAGRNTYTGRLHEAEVTFGSIQAEMRVAQANRTSIAEPVGLVWEVVVLSLVAVLTIAPSLALLAPQPAHLTRGESAVVVALFTAGLIMLIAYLIRWAAKARNAWAQEIGSPDLDFVIERQQRASR